MKISLNWLRDYVAINLDPSKVADLLTMSGLEVESLDVVGRSLDGVIVGKVLSVEQHPNADRLVLCKVNTGSGEPLSIVCGAPNVAAGQLVAVATAGTTLSVPDPGNGTRVELKIKRSKIRGEVSEGMICAADELGIGDSHDGILVLDASAKIGEPVAGLLAAAGHSVSDAVLDVAITPNRPDATSHIGVARDIAVLTNTPLSKPDVTVPDTGGEAATLIDVEIESPRACPRYAAAVVADVKIGPSPPWLQARLRAVGLRPRNNVVDIANFVMLETGQPLHTFDLDTIAGPKIVVRETSTPLLFTTLDGKERTLPPGTLMICDGKREVAVAGVMGGLNSEVTDSTTRVLIESAYFEATGIRRTSRALGLQTDASYRFERGVDPAGQAYAAARAAALIAEHGQGRLVDGIVDRISTLPEPRRVTLRLNQIERHLGGSVERSEVERLLSGIGFEIAPLSNGSVECTVPTFRPDIEREIDVIEEIARLHGYDSFPLPTEITIPNFTPRERPVDAALDVIHVVLRGQGFREVCTNSLVSEDLARQLIDPLVSTQGGNVVVTANPVTSEMTTLRPTLLAGMLPVVRFNANRGQDRLRLFETGNVFLYNPDETSGVVPGYAEHTSLLLLAAGPRAKRTFDTTPGETDYFDIKGVVVSICTGLQLLADFALTHGPRPFAGYGETVSVGGKALGFVGRLSDSLADQFDAPAPVYFAELNLDNLVAAKPNEPTRYRAVSRYQAVDRDIAMVVDRSVAAGSLLSTVRSAGGGLLIDADIFDIYSGAGVPERKKSVAISLRFGADRTLTDAEVDEAVDLLISAIGAEHGGELRT